MAVLDPRPSPPASSAEPLAYERADATASTTLPQIATALAILPMIGAVAATAGYVLTDPSAFEIIGLLVAAVGIACVIAAAALMSVWQRRAERRGVPADETWYRRRRVSVAMFVNLPVACACLAIGTWWERSELVTVTNTGAATLRDVRIEYVGAIKDFGDLPPGATRARRFFPGTGRLAAEWTVEGVRHSKLIDDPFHFVSDLTIVMDGERAYRD